ncbi:MAG: hypothetical protein JSS58_05385 [Proteobacteria bacterium]|nr:hypothetical protein [Pseudomonadota bacterium]
MGYSFWIGLFIALLYFFIQLKEWRDARKQGGEKGRLNPESRTVVSFDDEKITVRYENGEGREVRWDALTMIGIRTTDEGPFRPDMFWGLHAGSENPAVVYPQGATGDGELLHALQRRLPGFDNRTLIEVMGSTENNFFLIWKRAEPA